MAMKNPFNSAADRPVAINKQNRHGTNKLIEAIEKKKTGLVEAMLEQGADLDFRTGPQTKFSGLTYNVPYSKDSTPLHAACLHGSPVIVSMLLDKNPDVNAKNHAGHTPLDYALLSYTWYKGEYERKSQSKFTFKSSVEASRLRMEEFAFVISQMTNAGGKVGLFEMPPELTLNATPAQKAGVKPPPPPLP